MNNTSQALLWPGWETVRCLGSGTYGAVYEIQRNILGTETLEKAAVKVLSVPTDPEEIRQQLNEGYDRQSIDRRLQDDLQSIAGEYQLMAQLKGNANIVYCEDLRYRQNENGIGYTLMIKMELLTPLRKALSGGVTPEQTIRLGMDLCNALIACEKKGIVHRDIKPENILVSQDGHYKLGDFGVAKVSERTSGGTKTGTYAYMAPEVYHGKPYNCSVDQYSLGMVLYWMLNGRCGPFLPPPPTVPKSSQMDAANQRRFSGEALPRPTHGSRRLQDIVLKACAFRPEDRYASPADLYADLAALDTQPKQSDAGSFTQNSAQNSAGHAQTGGGAAPVFDSSGCYRSGPAQKRAPSGQVPPSPGVENPTIGNSWGETVSGATVGTGFDKAPRGATVGADFARKKPDGSTASRPTGPAAAGPFDRLGFVQITAQEARTGTKAQATTVDGEDWIYINIPPNTSEGALLRVPGRGKQDPSTGARGDALIRVNFSRSSENFWGTSSGGKAQNTAQKQPETVLLPTGLASKGGKLRLYTPSGSLRTLDVPAKCKDGDTVQGYRVRLFDLNDSMKEDMSQLSVGALLLYAQESPASNFWTYTSGGFLLGLLGTLICVSILPPLAAIPLVGFTAVGAVCGSRMSRKIRKARKLLGEKGISWKS